MEYFTYENMEKLQFQSPKEANETLRAKAQESGFDLAAKDPFFPDIDQNDELEYNNYDQNDQIQKKSRTRKLSSTSNGLITLM